MNSNLMKTDFWNTVAMKKLEENEKRKINRKLLKPQVERRRRERMNRSLENLRILLLQEPGHQNTSQRRVEKAEILEHTVLFMQTSITEAKKIQHEKEEIEGRQFLDGFSACLQKASEFLQEESEARGLQDSVASSLYQSLSRPHMLPTPQVSRARITTETRQKCSTQGLQNTRKNTMIYKVPLRHTDPNAVRRHGKTARTSQSISNPQAPVTQCVWRPWP